MGETLKKYINGVVLECFFWHHSGLFYKELHVQTPSLIIGDGLLVRWGNLWQDRDNTLSILYYPTYHWRVFYKYGIKGLDTLIQYTVFHINLIPKTFVLK